MTNFPVRAKIKIRDHCSTLRGKDGCGEVLTDSWERKIVFCVIVVFCVFLFGSLVCCESSGEILPLFLLHIPVVSVRHLKSLYFNNFFVTLHFNDNYCRVNLSLKIRKT